MGIGDVLIQTLTELEDGSKVKSDIDFKINSRDFRRKFEKFGHKIDDMRSAFEVMGRLIEQFHILHFNSDTGPDREGNLISWPAYSDRAGEGRNWIDKKMNHPDNTGGDKLLHFTGALRESLQKGGTGNIHVVTNRRLEIGTEIPYAHFHQEGFNTNSHGQVHNTEEETKRPFFGMTDEEEEEAMEEFEKEFFKDLF